MAPARYPHGLLQAAGFWVAIFAIPVIISFLWYLLSHWGWWKLRRPGPRPVMVRSWHGWIESGTCRDKRHPNCLRKPPRRLPRTTRADYDWIFWDPTGELQRKFNMEREESLVRYLPRWMRSSPFGSAGPAGRDVESLDGPSEVRGSDPNRDNETMGTLAFLERQWRSGWLQAKAWASSSDTYVESPEPDLERQSIDRAIEDQNVAHDSATTARMRKPTRYASPNWEVNRDDVERATHTQLLAPTAVGRLIQLFRRPSPHSRYATSSTDVMNAPWVEGSQSEPEDNPPLYLLPGERSVSGSYHPFHDNHHVDTTSSNPWRVIQSHYPTRRIRTWTYGLDGPQPCRTSATQLNIDGNTQSSPASTSLAKRDLETVERFPYEEPTLYVPRTRRGRRGTVDSTTAAENMSIIDVPFHSTPTVPAINARVGSSFNAQDYEEVTELDNDEPISDTDGFSSVTSSRAVSLM